MKRTVLTIATALALVPVATTAFAADTVSQVVTPGTRTASVADLRFSAMGYSQAAQTPTGSMSLTADDSTGSGAG